MSAKSEAYAAIDLGSNSFHMIVASLMEGRIQIVDKIREPVRLAGGLDKKQKLTEPAMSMALECLERFGQRIKEIPLSNIRAVGTNTLRKARNSKQFLKSANIALGHPIEIISGREEARLVYLGVANNVYNETDRRLVIDIGGGSTEFVIGQGFNAEYTESLYMGCVSMSEQYFPGGEISAKKMRKAILAARQELETIELLYKRAGWDSVIGTSGTNIAIQNIIAEKGWGDTHITADALLTLKNEVIKADHIDDFSCESLSSFRRQVILGGIAILCAAFEALEITSMDISDGALREGLLHDLIGRLHDQDIREKTVVELANRYKIDETHADHIEKTVVYCFEQLQEDFHLDANSDLKILKWAARLHEIGISIAHSQYHKHGAYLLQHSELPGFSRQEQTRLAMLVKCHRRKFPVEELQGINDENQDNLLILIIIFRLAVVLNRDRNITSLPEFSIECRDDLISIRFPEGWLQDHPLTHADLDTEAGYFSTIRYNLTSE